MSLYLSGMMSRVAMNTRTWRSETNSGNSLSLNWLIYLAKALKSCIRTLMSIAFLNRRSFMHSCSILQCVQFTHLYAGFKKSIFNRERIFAHRKSCESLQRLWKRNCNKLKALRHRRQSANLKRSCNRNVNEQVLYWQGPPHLLNLIAVLVLLHEEHVGDILRLAGLKDIGKLWGILG